MSDTPREKVKNPSPAKCRGCGQIVGEPGTRSLRGSELPSGVMRRAGRLFHADCLKLAVKPHRHVECGCEVCLGRCVKCPQGVAV